MTRPVPSERGGQSITIGLRDLYDMVQEMSRAQVTLAAKIDSALISQTMAQQSFAQQVADLRHDMTDHEARLRAQEARIYVTPRGMWTGIGVIIAALAALFGLVQLILSAT